MYLCRYFVGWLVAVSSSGGQAELSAGVEGGAWGV